MIYFSVRSSENTCTEHNHCARPTMIYYKLFNCFISGNREAIVLSANTYFDQREDMSS